MIEQYYQDLCQRWGYTPTADVCTGYEHIYPLLQTVYSKDSWNKATAEGKENIQDEVFQIYRQTNIVPITYYSLDGCRQQLIELSNKKKSVDNRTLGVGNNEGLGFGRFWFENMQDAHTRKDKEVSTRGRFLNDAKLKRAIKLCYVNRNEGEFTVLPKNIRRALELVSGGSIQNFKPMNARAVWEYICPNFMGHVLDFSSGYGGRMMGAMSSRLRYHYTGIDPNTRTYNGLNALGKLMEDSGLGLGYEMHCMPSEEFEPEPGRYDAAFSSPPYFNLETYSDESTQCMNRHTNLDAWFEQYVEPTLAMIHQGLDRDGLYAVNIADYKSGKDQYAIVDRWKTLSEKVGFKYQETVDMMLNVRPGVGNNKLENGYKSEGIYIFCKKP